MNKISQQVIEVFSKIILTVILSGFIGTERFLHQKGAGMRTHILLGVGSTLLVLTSFYVSDIHRYINPGDPTRVIAAIVTGIGFLCAGTIIRTGDNITGLTTSASLWVVSGIGIAVGAGYWIPAVIVTLVVFGVLASLRSFEKKLETYFKKQ
ncbi:MAG: MgtC/SapB family protein [Candidatus Omnitrophica bacterium]|nr:MgtC/SapB family protein [Candidatus Omnitrophota bacterium]